MELISLFNHFENLEDLRMNRTKKYKLIDAISICAMIAGCDDYAAIVQRVCLKTD